MANRYCVGPDPARPHYPFHLQRALGQMDGVPQIVLVCHLDRAPKQGRGAQIRRVYSHEALHTAIVLSMPRRYEVSAPLKPCLQLGLRELVATYPRTVRRLCR